MRELDLSDNSIQKVDARVFKGLRSLTVLTLANNQISDLPQGLFEDCTALSRLNLHQNDLKKEAFTELNRLVRLSSIDLSGNTFKELPYLMLGKLGRLTSLTIRDADIVAIDSNAFIGLKQLQNVDLSENAIARLDRETFQPLTIVSFLSMEDNPIVCDCGTKQFQDWLKDGGRQLKPSWSCQGSLGQTVDIETGNLARFCDGTFPTKNPPAISCGSGGHVELEIRMIYHNVATVTLNSEQVPGDVVLITNVRKYGVRDSDTWGTVEVDSDEVTLRNLTPSTPYVFCVFHRDCVLYTCLDFQTQNDPSVAELRESACVGVEVVVGVAFAAAFIAILVFLIVFRLMRYCHCRNVTTGNRRTEEQEICKQPQPVLPMQVSQGYVSSSQKGQVARQRSVNSENTYDAIPSEETHGIFFNPSYKNKDRPRNVNDPLPPIGDTKERLPDALIERDKQAVGTTHAQDADVINGIRTYYLHPPTEGFQKKPSLVLAAQPETYLEPIVTLTRRLSKRPHDAQLRHTTPELSVMAGNTEEPYHLYQEAAELAANTGSQPILSQRQDGPGQLSIPKLRQQFEGSPSLEDVRRQLDNNSGRVKRFRRPQGLKASQQGGFLGAGRSASTPDILIDGDESFGMRDMGESST